MTEAPYRLGHLARNRYLALFPGAGISQPARHPQWRRVITELAKQSSRNQLRVNEVADLQPLPFRTREIDPGGNLLADTLTYYDGPAEQGLPLGRADQAFVLVDSGEACECTRLRVVSGT